VVLFSLVVLGFVSFTWWRDVVRESLLGVHTSKFELGLRSGIILFILSEVFFFVSFF
jgi:heme/copper-type cytochrome/quinol oxidase subunit 3